MDAQATAEILRVFTELPDPRRANARHKLWDILTLALRAVICGANGWEEVAAHGQAKFVWLRTFLDLPSGIPRHDTFGRVFARLDSDAFEAAFRRWIGKLAELSGGRLVARDAMALHGDRRFQAPIAARAGRVPRGGRVRGIRDRPRR